jgi:DNA repair photolyase
MGRKDSKLEISRQFLQCPMFLSIDTYEGCENGCRYCFSPHLQDERHRAGRKREEPIRETLLSRWGRALNGESIGSPMIEYLVSKKHPIQCGTKADPFPRRCSHEMKNTRSFLHLCNDSKYPVYISTKNTDLMPLDLLADGEYVLAVSLASHREKDIRMLEASTIPPVRRIKQIPSGVFKKVVVRWQPFIPQLFKPRNSETISWSGVEGFLDLISEAADALSISFLSERIVSDTTLFADIGPDLLDEVEELEILTGIKELAHSRGLEFYTANYRAISDSPICCGLRGNEFDIATQWVWGFLIWKLFTGENEYLTVDDLIAAFPDDLKHVKFATMNVALSSRWARYSAKKNTILDEYIRTFTRDRKMNPVNYFAGLYSRVVDGEFRIYFQDYREVIGNERC